MDLIMIPIRVAASRTALLDAQDAAVRAMNRRKVKLEHIGSIPFLVWLIERGSGSSLEYHSKDGTNIWTANPYYAMLYPSQEEAEQAIRVMIHCWGWGRDGLRAEEHSFHQAAPGSYYHTRLRPYP